ncbi:ATP-binding protein [Candidatus Poribacteria bacterium]|nr:ATP-binding protein [Candidatus Poribacteria bacterium]
MTQVNLLVNIQLLVIVVLTGLGGFVLLKRPKHLPAQLLALLCLLTTAWICLDIGTTLSENALDLDSSIFFRNASKVCTTHLVAVFVFFSWFFPDQYITFKKWKMGVLLLTSFSFSILAFTPWDVRSAKLLNNQLQIQYGLSHYLYSVYIMLGGTYAIATLWQRFQDTSSYLIRTQLKHVLLGLGITFILSTIFSVILPTFFGFYDYFFIGTLAPLVGFSNMAYAIVRHRAMDIQTAVHYTLSWLLVTSLLLLPIHWLFFFSRTWLSTLSNPMLSFVATGLFWTFFFYVRKVQPFIDRLFHRDFHRMQAGIEEVITNVSSLQSFSQLSTEVENTIRDYLHLPNSILLVRNLEGDFTRIDRLTKFTDQPTSISEYDPFIEWLSRSHLNESDSAIFSLEDILKQTTDDSVIVAAKDYFNQMKVRLCMPLVHKRIPTEVILNTAQSTELIATLNFRQEWLKPRQLELVLRLRAAITMSIENAYLHQLQLRSRQSQTASELISAVSGALAHSIKNPLGLLDANIDLLKSSLDQNEDKNVDSALNSISQQVSRIDHTIRQIRNADIIQPDLQRCKLSEILREALNETERLYPDQFVNTKIDDTAEILADRVQLRLAFVNLLTNALQSLENKNSVHQKKIASSTLSGSLYVSVEKYSDNYKIEIRDNGSGMTTELIEKVMNQPFVTRKQNGTGLGLWTAKKIIDSHSGGLKLTSKLNVGTTVTVTLPPA